MNMKQDPGHEIDPTQRPPQMQRIGLIGYGAIGRAVHELLLIHATGTATVAGILIPPSASIEPAAQNESLVVTDRLETLLAADIDIVVECAGHNAVDAYAVDVLRAGLDLVLVSIGALADAEREQRLRHEATAAGRQMLLPSGAIGGIDWIGAARSAGLSEVLYRSRKSPLAWSGTDAERLVDLASLTSAAIFFRGTAREAAIRFPRNANVAATVALAGLGLDATQVELIADPATRHNVHEIEADSAGGSMSARIKGMPDPGNPKTSLMTGHSVLRTILHRRTAMVI
ncbi:aspartate dehydrogenase [Variovorax sp. RB2P76]|uniref:aspartate dehydrogenase n=1 Tax=Variovorax sp. RB2P76 TaxID=3443736 RepID=UPI003F476843